MNEEQRAHVERAVRELCDRNEHRAAVEIAIRDLGPEVLGFLVATNKSEQDASDVFSDVCLALTKGLPSFEWQSSFRTWVYTIARNAATRFRRDSSRRVGNQGRVGESVLEAVEERVRTETLAFLRTRSRTRLEQLRDALDPSDQELLVLRVDRGLSWNELAGALHDGDEPLDVTRESQRLRKRFQLLKDRLREMARKEGLIT